jgi:hypothetical protein
MEPDRAAAHVLPILLSQSLDDSLRERVSASFALAVTHSNNEVRLYAASGVGQHLWLTHRELVMPSINILATEANLRILMILLHVPQESIAIGGFQRLSRVLVQWWDEDDDRSHHRKRQRSDTIETVLTGLLEEFLMRSSSDVAESILQPILGAVDRHPKEVSSILQGVIGAEVRQARTIQFWNIWRLIANRTKTAVWLRRIDDR